MKMPRPQHIEEGDVIHARYAERIEVRSVYTRDGIPVAMCTVKRVGDPRGVFVDEYTCESLARYVATLGREPLECVYVAHEFQLLVRHKKAAA